MATTTSTNSVITSSINVSSMVSQLMTVESQPLNLINKKISAVNANLSAYGQLKSALASFQDTVKNLSTTSKFNAQTAKSSDAAVLTATSDGAASLASYQINVSQLAQAQKQVSSNIVNDTSFAAGSVTINGSPLAISAGKLTDVRDAINAGNTSVTASIVNNGTNDLLVLTSQKSGAANTNTVSFSDGLAGITIANTALVAAQDALFNVDGIAVNSASNTVVGVLPGMTLSLNGVSASPTTKLSLSLTTDEVAIKKSVNSFVDGYNQLKTTVANLTKYDTTGKNNGALFGDSTTREIMNSIQSILADTISSNSTLSYLSNAGITLQKTGQLAIDNTKLTTAINSNFSELSAMFADTGSANVGYIKGYAAQLSTKLDSILNTTDGVLSTKTEGLNTSIKTLNAETDVWNLKLDSIKKRYTAQFSSLDQLLTNLTNKNTFLTQQLDALAKQTGK